MTTMRMPEHIKGIIDKIVALGGRPLIVGGSVRDMLLGMSAKDFDIEVFGLTEEQLIEAVKPHNIDLVGKSFGVFKVNVGGEIIDISFPRREHKTTVGHKGFEVVVDPNATFSEASARRDFTINALAFNPVTGEVMDAHNGLEDVKNKMLRHTSQAFAEDPLRVLRAMRFASRFGFTVASETVELCRSLKSEFHTLPRERVWGEWESMLLKSNQPSMGLEFLNTCGWIEFFPELAALRGVQQDPEWHPEGDVWEHTKIVLDATANVCRTNDVTGDERLTLMLAALLHDVGKAVTTEFSGGRWHAYGHDDVGVPIAKEFMGRMGVPSRFVEPVLQLVETHMIPHSWVNVPKVNSVRRLSTRVNLRQLAWLNAADSTNDVSRVEIQPLMQAALEIAESENVTEHAPDKVVTGKLLLSMGFKPGKQMGMIISQAFEAQLDGIFNDEDSGRAWVNQQAF